MWVSGTYREKPDRNLVVPKFVILVKFDRPRYGGVDRTWGSTTAAPVFKEITTFLLEYYDIPPDE